MKSIYLSIREGKLKGNIYENFISFKNIPYGKPPIGNLRFRAPLPAESWQGVHDATQEGNRCMSKHPRTKKIVGSEDCLILNVYMKDINYEKLKPVMFWIHGGLFLTGSSEMIEYGPDFLVKEDVVLVTINFRLGILGFLSLDDPDLNVPGNAGLKDIVMALKWVQRNVKNFGGDPNNVTIFGESSGAAATHLLMLSPMAKNLFHKVIIQSSCALCEWIFGRRSASQIALKLGLSSNNDRKILKFLQEISAENILTVQLEIEEEAFMENDLRFIGVAIERPSDEEAFLSEFPIDIILSGEYTKVPMMIGYNTLEGTSFKMLVKSKLKENYLNNIEYFLPVMLNIERGSPLSKLLENEIIKFYFEGKKNISLEKNIKEIYKLTTDASFLINIYRTIKFHKKTSSTPIYFYRMSIESELNLYKKLFKINEPGVSHGDDIGYLFKTMYTPKIKPDSIEDITQKQFVRLWTNLSKYGNPTPIIVNDQQDNLLLNNVKWRPVEEDIMYYLDIGEKLTMKYNPDPENIAFWERILKYNLSTKL